QDRTKRIAALIERLDEETGSDRNNRHAFDTAPSKVAHVLVREGEAALPALLDCFEKDARMTRQVIPNVNRLGVVSLGWSSCRPVHEAAELILWDLLPDVHLSSFGEGAKARRRAAAWARASLRKTGHVPLAERCFRILADDGAKDNWVNAAEILVRRDFNFSRPLQDQNPPLLGEGLRSRKNPSVTKLILQRTKQTTFPYEPE